IELSPSIQIKVGISRKLIKLNKIPTQKRENVCFINDIVELKGKWDNSPVFGSLLSLKLKNISKHSIKLCRLVFPTENGLDDFLKDFNYKDVAFLRNGYQSWSTARSYKVTDKPLRPWLQLVSLASSNLANLPSNTPGNLSSEMFSVITDAKKNSSFLVGQCSVFDQFFYIRLVVYKNETRKSFFELVFDFGRKMIKPGETVDLDGIVMARGDYITLQQNYFDYIKRNMNINILKKNLKGWSTWYYYYTKISPEIIYKNLEVIKSKKLDISYIEIDDGYQKSVGDWDELNPRFDSKMKEIADKISNEGFIPGIWIAPFIADVGSNLVKNNPDYVLRTEYGRPIIAGYNPLWKGKFYYGLDVTNPGFEEHIRNIIRVYVKEWGFRLLKLDFLYGGCLRGANHNNLRLSRAEVLKYGMNLIRDEAGKEVILIGCGMPLSCGIGSVHSMRIGPDTATYWKKMVGSFLQTGAMIGARNSIRNTLVRSLMNKRLWINDPDCFILRQNKNKLSSDERITNINAALLSGGTLFYSDNFTELSDYNFQEISMIDKISNDIFKGDSIPLDLMTNEIPEIYYNTSGYIGVFNFKNFSADKIVDFSLYKNILNKSIKILKDVWTEKLFYVYSDGLELRKMKKRSGYLFKIIG
ncbi:MAG TPA: alpha-galactosidase, partial [Spirochaetota bacterium]|nr:alpha-galactosidase [Spirochaetota bacterium]